MPSISDAVILMAGAGSRLGKPGGALAKPLVRIAGRPLVCYALDAFERAGVRNVHVVLGANSERLAAEMNALLPEAMTLHPIINADWRKQNGVSVLSAEGKVRAPFFLTMGDHLFEFPILERLLAQGDRARVNLAIDRKIETIFDLDDAMKVRTDGERILAISKELEEYDAIDTGVFLCSESIFSYLKSALRDGDCSLSDGVRLLAADGEMRAIDIGDAWWQDIDTPEMLQRAVAESARLLRQSGSRLAQERVASES